MWKCWLLFKVRNFATFYLFIYLFIFIFIFTITNLLHFMESLNNPKLNLNRPTTANFPFFSILETFIQWNLHSILLIFFCVFSLQRTTRHLKVAGQLWLSWVLIQWSWLVFASGDLSCSRVQQDNRRCIFFPFTSYCLLSQWNMLDIILALLQVAWPSVMCVNFAQVCLGWPVASYPGGRVGLQKCAQKNLRVKPGDKVTVHPLTGPVLRAEQVVLSIR